MPGRISPNYDETKLDRPSVADVVDVLEDRVRGWIIEPARSLAASDTGHMPAVCLLLTYFEGIWSYKVTSDSRGRSREFFICGFVDVFRDSGQPAALLRRTAGILYDDARCGFFHDGISRQRIYVGTIDQSPLLITLPRRGGTIDVQGEIHSIVINAQTFSASIEAHLSSFVENLRSDPESDSASQFFEFCRSQWGWDTEPVPIGIDPPCR